MSIIIWNTKNKERGACMPKFFVNKNQVKDGNIEIIGEDVKHIEKVLRYEKGDTIMVCDGEGADYLCEIIELVKDKVVTQIVDMNSTYAEPNVKITIYQGLPKGDKMESIIQKSVELGVGKIVPVAMKNSVVKIDDIKKEQKKIERWNKISESAAKQCGRGVIPKVDSILSFDDALKDANKSDLKILLYENEKKLTIAKIFDINNIYGSISVFIGPEGGFSESEIDKAKKNNFNITTLGNRILRTETVSTVILSILMYCMGEI